MLIKEYEIPLLCRMPEYLNSVLENVSQRQTLSVLEEVVGYVIKSNSNNISDGYVTGDSSTLPKIFSGDYMIAQPKGESKQTLYTELIEDPKHLDDPEAFLNRYLSILKTLKEGKVEVKEKDFRIYYVKITETQVAISTQEEYEDITSDFLEFAVVKEDPKELVKLVDEFHVSKEQIISLPEGYYNIYPRIYNNSNNVSEYDLNIFSPSFSKISSDLKISVNGWILNNTTLPPNTKIYIETTEDCLNELNGTDVFDETKEYILYEVRDKEFIPVTIISTEGEEPAEEFKTLVKSHREFLRNYLYIQNKVVVSVNGNPYEIKNKDFEQLKETFLNKIPHYNFNF